MDVESVESRGQAVHLSSDLDFLALDLDKLGPSAHTRATVWVEDANCVVCCGCSSVDHLKLFLTLSK